MPFLVLFLKEMANDWLQDVREYRTSGRVTFERESRVIPSFEDEVCVMI
jgi:hypothetical protein